MRIPSLFLALILCLGGCSAPAAETPAAPAPPSVTQLGPWLQAEAAADRFSGAVILARGDQVLHRAA